MNGPDNVFLGFLVESGVRAAKKTQGKIFAPSQTHHQKLLRAYAWCSVPISSITIFSDVKLSQNLLHDKTVIQ